jgi:hypothetical protein
VCIVPNATFVTTFVAELLPLVPFVLESLDEHPAASQAAPIPAHNTKAQLGFIRQHFSACRFVSESLAIRSAAPG